MEEKHWVYNFDYAHFLTPVNIDQDNLYLNDIRTKLDDFIDKMRCAGAPKTALECIYNFKNQILKSMELYYSGDLLSAQSIINTIIQELNVPPAVTPINKSFAFPYNTNEIQFFRARTSDAIVDYNANEMLHIPFSKRSHVKSYRFSISGLPCLYLGNTSYACWIEMRKPADYRFNVSPVVLDNSQKVLNLIATASWINTLVSNNYIDLSDSDSVINMFKLMVLTYCTSYKVKEQDRNFKSEYVLPQMIMLACKRLDLDGVVYYSKQVSDERFATVTGINVALFATYEDGLDLSPICSHIKIDDSFNYSTFKQLHSSLKYKEYPLCVDKYPQIKNIGNFKRQIPYRETYFYEFDKYLFANWEK